MIMASPNFSMDELTHSDTAARHGIDNTPNDNQKENLYKLAMEMEDVRELLNNKPIFVLVALGALSLIHLSALKKHLLTLKDLLVILYVENLGRLTKLYSLLLTQKLNLTNSYLSTQIVKVGDGCISLFVKMKKHLADRL
jgi:hypothetical protein